MPYLVRNSLTAKWVADIRKSPNGSAYTKYVEQAQVFDTEAEARRNCCANEYVVSSGQSPMPHPTVVIRVPNTEISDSEVKNAVTVPGDDFDRWLAKKPLHFKILCQSDMVSEAMRAAYNEGRLQCPESETQCPQYYEKIDWVLLRQQKRALLDLLRNKNRADADSKLFEGLLTLLDAMMDDAAKTLGEEKVFGKLES